MARTRTLALLKPDAVHRGLVGAIISRFEQAGMKILAMKLFILSEDQLHALYPGILSKPFYVQVRNAMLCGPCVAIVLEANEAIAAVYHLSGTEKNPEQDFSMSIRKSFATWTGADVIHRATNESEAEFQIRLLFSSSEICNYYKLGEEFSSAESWQEFGGHWSDRGY